MAGAEPEQAKVERTLEGAGFTDVEIMLTAFLVRAKNPEGQRVIMVVDPISLTVSVIENSRSTPEDTTSGMAHAKSQARTSHRLREAQRLRPLNSLHQLN